MIRVYIIPLRRIGSFSIHWYWWSKPLRTIRENTTMDNHHYPNSRNSSTSCWFRTIVVFFLLLVWIPDADNWWIFIQRLQEFSGMQKMAEYGIWLWQSPSRMSATWSNADYSTNAMYEWIGWRDNLRETLIFDEKTIVSCRFSLRPLQWICRVFTPFGPAHQVMVVEGLGPPHPAV